MRALLAGWWQRWRRARQVARINQTLRRDYLLDSPLWPCFGGPRDGRRISYGIAEDLYLERKKRGGSYHFCAATGRFKWRAASATELKNA